MSPMRQCVDATYNIMACERKGKNDGRLEDMRIRGVRPGDEFGMSESMKAVDKSNQRTKHGICHKSDEVTCTP